MLTPEQIERYNPANAKNLTPEELAVLPGLDNDELKQLANRYPAQANGQAYLVLHEAGAKTQIGKVSTYPALHSLRTRHLLKQYSIATFGVLQAKTTTSTASAKPGLTTGKITDLTDKEIQDAPGLVRGQVKELVEIKPRTPEEKAELLGKIAGATTYEELTQIIPSDEKDPELANAAMQRAEALRRQDGTTVVPGPESAPEAPKLRGHREVIASIKVAKTIDDVDALIVGDTRKSVTDAAAARKAELA